MADFNPPSDRFGLRSIALVLDGATSSSPV
jgi:hypothetical protein